MYNYTPQAIHRAKFDFDPTTWVVWANSQFTTVLGVFLSSFLRSFLFCFLRLAYKSRRRMNRHRSTLIRRVLRHRCASWGIRIFACFSPKIVKIKPEIGNYFKPKCWNMKYKIFQKLRNRSREKLTQNWEHKSQFSNAILWWRHNKSKVAYGRHIENRFFDYISGPYWLINAKFGTEMKDHMPI